jgi:hypothetical protein
MLAAVATSFLQTFPQFMSSMSSRKILRYGVVKVFNCFVVSLLIVVLVVLGRVSWQWLRIRFTTSPSFCNVICCGSLVLNMAAVGGSFLEVVDTSSVGSNSNNDITNGSNNNNNGIFVRTTTTEPWNPTNDNTTLTTLTMVSPTTNTTNTFAAIGIAAASTPSSSTSLTPHSGLAEIKRRAEVSYRPLSDDELRFGLQSNQSISSPHTMPYHTNNDTSIINSRAVSM